MGILTDPVWGTALLVCQVLFNLAVLWVILFHVNSHYTGIEGKRKKHRM